MRRYKHSLSNYRLTTMDMGELVPVGCHEVLPGDTFNHQTSALIRTSPLVAPVMHPVQVRIHHWFVPYRILWDTWEDFITGVSSSNIPTVTSNTGRLCDRMGIPPGFSGSSVNALPIRAYQTIYNEFYRDQDLVTEVSVDSTAIRRVAWEKDYFTSARPFRQKGESATIPVTLEGDIPVKGIGIGTAANTGNQSVTETGGATPTYTTPKATSNTGIYIDHDSDEPQIFADLSAAAETIGIDVESFREAFALQRYAEARARYGSRYTEYLALLGVNSGDARLNRPEYLGGGKQTISFSEVLATAEGTNTEVGDLKGHGIGALQTRRYRRFFQEHGIVMTLMSVRPKSIYEDGVHRSWLRAVKEDFWQKELETLGQQEVSNQEVYSAHSDPTGVFGYQERYREYREQPSMVVGDFRSDLDDWHFARSFSSDPALNQTFVECAPADRPYSTSLVDPVVCMVNHSLQARRMVKKRGNV